MYEPIKENQLFFFKRFTLPDDSSRQSKSAWPYKNWVKFKKIPLDHNILEHSTTLGQKNMH